LLSLLHSSYVYRRERRLRPLSECARALAPHIGWTVAHFAAFPLIFASLRFSGYDGWTVGFLSWMLLKPFFDTFHKWTMRDNLPNESLALSNGCILLSLPLSVLTLVLLDRGWDGGVAVNAGLLQLSALLLYYSATHIYPRVRVYRRLAEKVLYEVGDVSDAPPIDYRG
jgi:hypothetical protein